MGRLEKRPSLSWSRLTSVPLNFGRVANEPEPDRGRAVDRTPVCVECVCVCVRACVPLLSGRRNGRTERAQDIDLPGERLASGVKTLDAEQLASG